MPAPSTPVEVVRHLSDLTGQLRENVRRYCAYEVDMVKARHEADLNEARVFLREQGSVEQRKMSALTQNEALEFAAVVAESNVRQAKAKIRTIETEIDVARTYGATVRAELATLNYGGEGA